MGSKNVISSCVMRKIHRCLWLPAGWGSTKLRNSRKHWRRHSWTCSRSSTTAGFYFVMWDHTLSRSSTMWSCRSRPAVWLTGVRFNQKVSSQRGVSGPWQMFADVWLNNRYNIFYSTSFPLSLTQKYILEVKIWRIFSCGWMDDGSVALWHSSLCFLWIWRGNTRHFILFNIF